MKKILLTKGKVALVDDADFEWLNKTKWHAVLCDSQIYYAARRVHIAQNKYTYKYMHRVILGLQRSDKRECDHRDGDGLNNQQANLRACTSTQNKQSSRKRKIGTSRHKGVSWNRQAHKWYSYIWVNKKRIFLGLFDLETSAATAYNQAALKYFGEFALLNTL